MNTFKFKGGARLAATAGLGLTLALGAAPAIAMAEEVSAETPSAQEQTEVTISSVEQLTEAISNQTDNQTWIIQAGNYSLSQWFKADINDHNDSDFAFPITADNLTIIGEGDVTITSEMDPGEAQGGAWNYQNFITVAGNNVTIQGIKVKGNNNAYYEGCNKAIEVLGDNFTFADSEILAGDNGESGGSLYFNGAINAQVKNSTIHSRISTTGLVGNGRVELDGVVVDFTTDPYAAESETYLPVQDNVSVIGSGLTVKVNGTASDVEAIINKLPSGSTLSLESDIALHNTLNILNKSDITIEGNGHTITAADDFAKDTYGQLNLVKPQGGKNISIQNATIKGTTATKHVLDVYGVDGLKLDNVTLDHTAHNADGGAPLIINGSSVEATGPLTLVCGEDSWYAANVDAKNGAASLVVKNPDDLTILGDSAAVERGVVAENTSYSDGSEGNGKTASVTIGGSTVTSGEDGAQASSKKVVATVGNQAFGSIQAAVDAAKEGDTIVLAPGTHRLAPDECIVLDKKVAIVGAADGTSVISGSGVTEYGLGLFTFNAGSEGSRLEGFGIDYTSSAKQRAAVYFNYGFEGSADEVTTISGVKFKGSGDLENENAIAISSTYIDGGNIDITGCTIEDFAYGMYFNAVHDLNIEGNTIDGTRYNAINIAADKEGYPCSDIEISGNTLKNVSAGNFDGDVYSSGINVGAGASTVSISGNDISMLNGKKAVNVVDDGDTDTCVITYKVDGADYAVAIATAEGGKVSYGAPADPSKPGYTFTGWDYAGADVSVSGGTATIVLPAVTQGSDFTFSATFSKNAPSNPGGGGSTTVIKHKVTVSETEGGKVEITPASAKKGDEVTITAEPELGMGVSSVTVKDASGKAVEVEAGKDANTWTFEMPGSAVTVEVSFADAWENPFTDVSKSDWFYGAVREANLLALMSGIGGTDLFSPASGAFREQAATVMWNWLGEDNEDAPAAPFADVIQSEWYAPYVNWANDSGLMTGYDGTDEFGVGDSLTREQFASMVARAAGADLDAVDTSTLEGFGDADGVSTWAESAMAWAVDSGVISGVETDDGPRELQATRGITRAEMAQMIVNAVKSGVVA